MSVPLDPNHKFSIAQDKKNAPKGAEQESLNVGTNLQ
jgi:hypothetical protein